MVFTLMVTGEEHNEFTPDAFIVDITGATAMRLLHRMDLYERLYDEDRDLADMVYVWRDGGSWVVGEWTGDEFVRNLEAGDSEFPLKEPGDPSALQMEGDTVQLDKDRIDFRAFVMHCDDRAVTDPLTRHELTAVVRHFMAELAKRGRRVKVLGQDDRVYTVDGPGAFEISVALKAPDGKLWDVLKRNVELVEGEVDGA